MIAKEQAIRAAVTPATVLQVREVPVWNYLPMLFIPVFENPTVIS